MKNIRYKFLLSVSITLMLCFSSCNDFLEEDVRSFLVNENFYATEADAKAAIVGVYDIVASFSLYNNAMWWMADLSTDDASPGPGVNNVNILAIEAYTHGPINDRIELMYRGTYQGINRANAVIERIPKSEFVSEANKKIIVAEAKFLRAFYYFQLVRFFGGVPMPLTETVNVEQTKVVRSTAEQVYQQIITDLNEAIVDLPETFPTADVGRATRGSANALIGKVYLTQKNWAKAEEHTKRVIDSKRYTMLAKYEDVFNVNNKNHSESIFDAQFKAGVTTEGSQLLLFAGPNQTQQTPRIFTGLNSSYLPDPAFADTVKQWRAGDLRHRTAFLRSFVFNNQTSRLTRAHIGKYLDAAALTSNFRDAANNFPVIRYADVLLMCAEALAEQGKNQEAIPLLNQVRRRGYGLNMAAASTVTDFPNAADNSQAWTLTRAILEERRWELCFEGHRWFDLARTGRLLTTLKAAGNVNIKDFHVLFPIPQRDIDINKGITQNPGYTL
jgi:starch-binding outer membrane protein, SusD/RagB family